MNVYRHLTKLQMAGQRSKTVIIPWKLVQRWQIKERDPMVLYEVGDLLTVVPLKHVSAMGEPELIEYLRQYNPRWLR